MPCDGLKLAVVWALEIVRLLAVLLSPCFFGMALYESIIQINLRWHVNALEFGPWASMPVGPMLVRLCRDHGERVRTVRSPVRTSAGPTTWQRACGSPSQAPCMHWHTRHAFEFTCGLVLADLLRDVRPVRVLGNLPRCVALRTALNNSCHSGVSSLSTL